MHPTESLHSYPRKLILSFTGISSLLVVLTALNLGGTFLRALWSVFGLDRSVIDQLPVLPTLVDWISGTNLARTNLLDALPTLLGPLSWFAAALLISLLLRNALPTVRVSAQGLLVEFAGSWLPISWRNLQGVYVTADTAGERFMLLTQVHGRTLTGWHRLYSLLYSFSGRPGFYISSSINGFETLVQTMLSESERAARGDEQVKAITLREDASSLLFGLFLSPSSFLSRRTAAETPASAPATWQGGPVRASYPARITSIIQGAIILIGACALWRYLTYWARFIALEVPAVRLNPLFSWTYTDPNYRALYDAYRTSAVPFFGVEGFPHLPQPWWLLVSAHLMLLLAFFAITWLRGILPNLESRDNGIAVTPLFGKANVVPWERVQAFKATEISEQSQILLLQGRGLSTSQRCNSLLYDGSTTPGVLITSAISNYEPLLASTLQRLAPLETAERPILQQEAASPVFWPAFSRRNALQATVTATRNEAHTSTIHTPTLLQRARAMVMIAALPALLLLAIGMLDGDSVPTFGLLLGALLLWFFGMLEWPIVALSTLLLDDKTGGGEEGYRALYVYPAAQLPRVIPLVAALILTIVGLPILPPLLWVAAIVWAFWQTSTLWEVLYEWDSTQAMLGGLIPVIWQLLLLIGFLVATR
jgi:hypothetical protein